MTNGFADTVVNGMLSWLKGFASWVLKLFDLAGSGGISPLAWLSDNWLQLLIVLLIVGVAMDILIWLIRWRPYWVWFRKKRVVVDDEDFFAAEKAPREDFARTLAPHGEARQTARAAKDERAQARRPATHGGAARLRMNGDAPGVSASQRRPRNRVAPKTAPDVPDIFEDDLFKIDPADPQARNQREDEVFNVSNLPGAQRAKKRKHEEDDHDDDLFPLE
ncbi:MAG TPA: hypothetical protein IAA75_06870 [Candidatus Pullichristensenella avicola]|nr:hypothetical protein [Candidatus Pullichristensenella avicola]